MKKMLVVITTCMLAALVWAVPQQPGGMPDRSGGQNTSPNSQMPSAGQQPTTPGTPGGQNVPPTGAQAGGPGQVANAPITEGCLGGSNPNFTITDSSGATYKLNIPPGADASVLNSHVGESVQVMGNVKQAANTNSIDVSRIGRGTGKCPGSATQPAPK
jgi:hypothetical protein